MSNKHCPRWLSKGIAIEENYIHTYLKFNKFISSAADHVGWVGHAPFHMNLARAQNTERLPINLARALYASLKSLLAYPTKTKPPERCKKRAKGIGIEWN